MDQRGSRMKLSVLLCALTLVVVVVSRNIEDRTFTDGLENLKRIKRLEGEYHYYLSEEDENCINLKGCPSHYKRYRPCYWVRGQPQDTKYNGIDWKLPNIDEQKRKIGYDLGVNCTEYTYSTKKNLNGYNCTFHQFLEHGKPCANYGGVASEARPKNDTKYPVTETRPGYCEKYRSGCPGIWAPYTPCASAFDVGDRIECEDGKDCNADDEEWEDVEECEESKIDWNFGWMCGEIERQAFNAGVWECSKFECNSTMKGVSAFGTNCTYLLVVS